MTRSERKRQRRLKLAEKKRKHLENKRSARYAVHYCHLIHGWQLIVAFNDEQQARDFVHRDSHIFQWLTYRIIDRDADGITIMMQYPRIQPPCPNFREIDKKLNWKKVGF